MRRNRFFVTVLAATISCMLCGCPADLLVIPTITPPDDVAGGNDDPEELTVTADALTIEKDARDRCVLTFGDETERFLTGYEEADLRDICDLLGEDIDDLVELEYYPDDDAIILRFADTTYCSGTTTGCDEQLTGAARLDLEDFLEAIALATD